jgi:putative ABC transport system permease protein
MFGIIVGVVSVITTVSLGEGIKRQVSGQVNHIGGNIITIRPGKVVDRDSNGVITKVNPQYAYGFGEGSLSEQDVAAIHRLKGIQTTSPVGLLNSGVSTDGSQYNDGFVLGTDAAFPSVLGSKVEFGSYFSTGEENRQVAIIGKRVAEQLFKENIPIGQTLSIRGQDFVVRGVFGSLAAALLDKVLILTKRFLYLAPLLMRLLTTLRKLCAFL